MGKQLIDTYGFYQTVRWTKTAIYIRRKYNYTCQKCGKKGTYVHHINPLTQEDYILRPVKKCFSEDNLTCLCHDCHEKEHSSQKYREGTYFDNEGQLRKVEDNNG